ncbi:S1 RNA-binding domain-containing protein [Olivibacter sp. XZL3]|uniref:CvfB family protein n=1 Tax=Olivibacter sp. XZL3 TaxID=1735116 RepID=UPI001065BCA9|nr:S1-like domain-containing RNA-binding protein [Olivibacter sp. XZL3]
MINVGKLNTLKIIHSDHLQYTLSDNESTTVALPHTNISSPLPKDAEEVTVFVYTNKQGVLTATTKKPYATVGDYALLKVVAEAGNGVFMDLGIEKDLFVPKKEQRWPMVKGKSYLVYIYLDPVNNHMVGSSKLNKHVDREEISVEAGDEVDLIIAEETDLGYNAIINNRHIGLLYTNEIFENLRIGNKQKGWVKKVYPDGKIDLSLQPAGYSHILDSKEVILDLLKKQNGKLKLGDKSSPDEVYKALKMSKKAFKKAIGALYKERLVEIGDHEIKEIKK